jgi:hypothetical protein
VLELKASKSDPGSDSDSELEKLKCIIDAEPSAIISTIKIHPNEPDESEEGECIFNLKIWVKGDMIHFIVNSGSQKNIIST